MESFSFLNPRINIGQWVADFITWLQGAIPGFFDVIQLLVQGAYDGLFYVLSTPTYLIIIAIFTIISYFVSGWRVALFTLIGFYLIRSFDVWEASMSTIALVILGVVIALIISIPIGIWAAKSSTVSKIVKPVCDLMQTLSPLVYLVPVMVIFGVGVVPGAVATIVFALPPGVRFTELAIRQVDTEVVEAGQAFGATPSGILGKIQIPLAMPTIMAGVNQVIMLALSMVVIAGMGGAGGLGGDIVHALGRVDVAQGVEAGLAVVIIAIFLDRLSTGLSNRSAMSRVHRTKV